MKLEADYPWIDPDPRIRGESDRNTLADFKLSVDERILTLNRSIDADAEFEEPRMSVRVSLFPLAEFIAANWWALLYEPHGKSITDSRAYLQRHQIRCYHNGFAYPSIQFYGADSRVQLIASSTQIVSAGIEFLTELGKGEQCTLHRNVTESTLLALVEAVLRRVTDFEDRSSLEEAVQAVNKSRHDKDEAEYCTLAGLLGCDPYDPDDRLEQVISSVRATVGDDLSKEIFATSELASAIQRGESVKRLAQDQLRKSKEASRHAAGLKKQFRASLRTPGMQQADTPWDEGYAAANELRRLLSISPNAAMRDDKTLRDKLLDGAPVGSIGAIDWYAVGARGVGATDNEGLGIATDTNIRINPRFQLVTTFADYLFADADDIFLSTAIATDRQKRNRAFAAEFLAPIGAIRARLGQRTQVTMEDLDTISQSFGVSRPIARYQIANQAPDLTIQ